MLFSGKFSTLWKDDEKRESTFVFIGRNLPVDLLKKGFIACEVPRGGELRFPIGTVVLANIGELRDRMEQSVYTCDGCESPIEGTCRYTSTKTDDFDLCETCHDNGKFGEHSPFEQREIEDDHIYTDDDHDHGHDHSHDHGHDHDDEAMADAVAGDADGIDQAGAGGDDMDMEDGDSSHEESHDVWLRAVIVAQWDEGNAYRLRLLEGSEDHEVDEEVFSPIDEDDFIMIAPEDDLD
jgi:hypothetical protein